MFNGKRIAKIERDIAFYEDTLAKSIKERVDELEAKTDFYSAPIIGAPFSVRKVPINKIVSEILKHLNLSLEFRDEIPAGIKLVAGKVVNLNLKGE
jgi:hypothetical protein